MVTRRSTVLCMLLQESNFEAHKYCTHCHVAHIYIHNKSSDSPKNCCSYLHTSKLTPHSMVTLSSLKTGDPHWLSTTGKRSIRSKVAFLLDQDMYICTRSISTDTRLVCATVLPKLQYSFAFHALRHCWQLKEPCMKTILGRSLQRQRGFCLAICPDLPSLACEQLLVWPCFWKVIFCLPLLEQNHPLPHQFLLDQADIFHLLCLLPRMPHPHQCYLHRLHLQRKMVNENVWL